MSRKRHWLDRYHYPTGDGCVIFDYDEYQMDCALAALQHVRERVARAVVRN
jgi:hypothetical protein